MKTQSHNPTTPRAAAIVLAVAGILVLTAGLARAKGPDVCPPCRTTAQRVRQASLLEARSDLWLGLANANNYSDIHDWGETTAEAIETFKEDTALAREQYDARLELCEALDECRYEVDVEPDGFLSPTEIAADPNPFWPLVSGVTMTYRKVSEEGTEDIVVTVTDETREILGVECVVVRDTVTLDGELVEDTLDWFTQDVDGNVWYFGEQSLEYEDGVVVGNDGSWEAGEEHAQPGIVMFANPRPGTIYRQEYALGEAEDAAKVVGRGETVTVSHGIYVGCLKTAEFSPMEPSHLEYKYYAPDVGLVLVVDAETGEREELTDIAVE